MSDVKIEHIRLDPFNISFYDHSTNTIYIDHKIEGTDFEKKVIKHEMKHVGKSLLHFEPLDFYWEAFKYKPLHALQMFFPYVIGWRKDGSRVSKIDPFGFVTLLLVAFLIAYVLNYYEIICRMPVGDIAGMDLTPECWKCTYFGCNKVTYIP